MKAGTDISTRPRWLRGGKALPVLIVAGIVLTVIFLYYYYIYAYVSPAYGKHIPFNHAMFGPLVEQPIAFSHRLHITDKQIDCYYCHSYGERSTNTGLPTAKKCLGCHNYIIPLHDEILKLTQYYNSETPIPWVKVYYKPDHVFFPHFRHLHKGVQCQECHGNVETVDRLNQVTFYMGYCLACHRERNAPTDCWACHQ